MVKPLIVVTALLLLHIPTNAPAFRYHRPESSRIGTLSSKPMVTTATHGRSARPYNSAHRYHFAVKPGHRPGHPVNKPCIRQRRRPMVWYPVAHTTVVREQSPVAVVRQPPVPEPARPPEPRKIWVPPVMDTRTVPGFWDYEITKTWMGDHWRFDQNLKEKKWVPEAVVQYVKQEGYWAFAE